MKNACKAIAAVLVLVFIVSSTPCFADDFKLKSVSDSIFERALLPDESQELASSYKPAYRERITRDCVFVSFTPEDELTCRPFTLESRFYETVCRYDRKKKKERCRERYVRSNRETYRIRISDRGEMYPWELDVFKVCLQGYNTYAYVREASHEYDLYMQRYSSLIEAQALYKVASEPDPKGIRMRSFDYDAVNTNFTLTLSDRWADYYVGEETQIDVTLRKSYGDSQLFYKQIFKKSIPFSAGATYTVDFSKYADLFSESIKSGKKYYVHMGFKRIGEISKDTYKHIGNTENISTPKAAF
ncbi:hypothetical protein ACFL6Y_08650 [Elusimicrobiota bacterium]